LELISSFLCSSTKFRFLGFIRWLVAFFFAFCEESELGSKHRFCPLPALLEPNSFASTLAIELLDAVTFAQIHSGSGFHL